MLTGSTCVLSRLNAGGVTEFERHDKAARAGKRERERESERVGFC